MSLPKMRAVPAVGLWKPSSVLMSVLLPAPLGPSRPMERPVKVALSFFRMVRLPKRTSKPSSSMTGSILLFKRRHAIPCSHELRKWNGVLQISGDQVVDAESHHVAIGGDADAIGLAVGGDQGRFHVAETLQHVGGPGAAALRDHAAEEADQRGERGAEVLVDQGGEVVVVIARQERDERGGVRDRGGGALDL